MNRFTTIKSIVMQYLPIFVLLVAIYMLANGVLHDFFVLMQYKEAYDRNLLRLLMDGHILITSSVMYIIAFFLLRQDNTIGLYLCLATSASLLIYCGMIFPFLKSYLTIGLNVLVFAGAAIKLLWK